MDKEEVFGRELGPFLVEKREWMEGHVGRWYYRRFYCAVCGAKIRTESWDAERCFGCGTILSDNTMPDFCPHCGTKISFLTEHGEERS